MIPPEELRQDAVPSRRKPRKRAQLTHAELKEVWDAVMVDKFTHAQAAVRFRVTKILVGKIIRSFKRMPDYIGTLEAAAGAKQVKVDATVAAVCKLQEDKQHILSAQQVIDVVRADTGVDVTKRVALATMKGPCGMRFGKVKKIKFQGNAERSLVMRQQCAKKLLDLLG